MNRRRLLAFATPALVYLALVLVMGWRLWWPDEAARRAFNWDALWQYWGDLQLQIDAYRAGELPLWNPFDRGGYPVHADPQAGLLYPPNWVVIGLGLVAGPGWWLVPVKVLFHLWLSAIGTFAYLRRRGTPLAAAYVGGAILVLAYPISKSYWTALNWSFAWAPWMLLAVDAWADRPDRRRAGALALAFAMSFLAWAPAASWYALLVVGPYAIVRVTQRFPDLAWRREALASGGVAIGLFLAMVVGQVLSASALVPLTVRADRTLDFVGFGVFGPDDLPGMIIPALPGEMAYFGFATLLWTAVALSVRADARRLALAGAALLGILHGMGSYAPFLPSLASLPGPFDLFRRPHRYLYVTALPLAILAAEGLAELARVEARRRFAAIVAVAGVLVAAVCAVGYLSVKPAPLRSAYAWGVLAVLVAAATSAAVVLLRGRLQAAAVVVAVLALGVDLYAGLGRYREKHWDPVPDTAAADAFALGLVEEDERIYDRGHLRYRPGTRLGVPDLGGYHDDPLALRRFALVRDLAGRAPRFLAPLGVRWLFEDGKQTSKKSAADRAILRAVKPGVFEVLGAAPPVYFSDRAAVARDDKAALAALEKGELTVVEGLPAALTGTGERVPGRFTVRRRNRLQIEIDAPAAGVVVVGEAFHPGWRARLDGELVPVLPANVLWRAVEVGPGHHVIDMVYGAGGFRLLAVISLLALAVALAMALVPPAPART